MPSDNILRPEKRACFTTQVTAFHALPDNNKNPDISRLVLLLNAEQRDFVDSKVDRLTSRSSYVRALIQRELEASK